MSEMFNHVTLQDLLPRYAGHALGDDERRRVQQHLEGCADCRAALGEWRAITAALRHDAATLPADMPPAHAWAALRARLPLVPVLTHQKGTAMDEPIVASEITNQPDRQSPSAAAARRRWLGIVSVAAVALIVVVSVALFGALHRAGTNVGTTGSNPTPTSVPVGCRNAKTSATLPQYTDLEGISNVSPTDVWASGMKADVLLKKPFTSAIYHLVNCQWQDMHVSLPRVSLDSISMVSAHEGWAAGSLYAADKCNCNSNPIGLVLLHYLNGQWQSATVPGTAAFIGGTIHFRAPDEGWLVASGPGASLDNGLFHYRNGAWQRVTLPASLDPGVFSPITPVGPNDVWFASFLTFNANTYASTADIVHWQNGHITTYPLPNNTFASSLSFPSPNDGWLTGSINTDFSDENIKPIQPILWHFDGSQWHNVALPAFVPPIVGDDTYFTSGSFASPQAGVAFGYTLAYGDNLPINGENAPLIFYQYQDGQWHTATVSPSSALHHASGIQVLMASPDEGWALARVIAYIKGSYYTAFHTVILHYSGSVWSVFEQ